MSQNIENLAVTTIRTLSIDTINGQIPGTQVSQWGQHQWHTHYGPTI